MSTRSPHLALSRSSRLSTALAVALLQAILIVLLALGLAYNPAPQTPTAPVLVETITLPAVPPEDVEVELRRNREIPLPVQPAEAPPVAGTSDLVEPIVPLPIAPEVPLEGSLLEQRIPLATGASGNSQAGRGLDGLSGSVGGGAELTKPARKLAGFIASEDYPRTALIARAQGTTVARIRIDERGRVSGCEVTNSSGHADLDSTVCRLLIKRYRFAPEIDARGQPIHAVRREVFTWVLPQER